MWKSFVDRFRRPFKTTVKIVLGTTSITSLRTGSFVPYSNQEQEETDSRRNQEVVAIPEPKEFSHTFQLRQSAARSVDSSILVLSTSLDCYLTAHLEYQKQLQRAISLLATAVDSPLVVVEHLGIEEQLSSVKAELFAQKAAISNALYVYDESAKMVNLSSSISFLVGNEVSSGLGLTHLHNVQQEVDQIKRETNQLEQAYLQLLQQFISKSSSSS